MKVFSLIFIFFMLSFSGHSQYYNTGQDPASVRWRQIKTDRYKLIFPAPFERKAQYFANILDIVTRHETHTLSAKVPRIPVLFHTGSSLSNGLTVWAPRRIELYPCPPQETNPEEWLEQLAVHEYRHAVQISKINQGFSKFIGYLFGEQVTGGILGLYIPSWFLEGDATVTETAMTRAGRGRSSLFESVLKAQVVEKGSYSFDKATLGSYKTFTPDAYALGYFLVGQARKDYGTDVWNQALDRTAKYPFMLVPFNSGIHKVTGLWKTQLYRQSLTELDSAWQKQLRGTHCTPVRHITRRNTKNYVNYNHPVLLNDSTIFADKTSMDDVTRFVLIDRKTGKERNLFIPGFHSNGTVSVSGEYLAWAESGWDPRWDNRNYSNIRILNFKTGKTRRITHRSRYFSPAISPDGRQIAAVTISAENKCAIDILEVATGRLLKRFLIPDGSQAITPGWSPGVGRILFILLTEKGETVAALELTTGRITNLLPFSFDEITGPVRFFNQFIVFTADHAGAVNICALDTLTSTVSRITSGRFANSSPDFTPDKKHMIYSDYTSDGFMVAETEADSSTWKPRNQLKSQSVGLFETVVKQEIACVQDSVASRNIWKMNSYDQFSLVGDTITGTIYPVRKYSKVLNLFNPHSWAPASFDINNLAINPGVMLLSQNILNTMFTGAGWEYNMNEQTGKFYASMSYRGWYPQFDFRFDIGNRAGYARYHGSNETFRFTWQETNFKSAVSVPINLSGGRYSRLIQPSIGTTLIGIRHYSTTPGKFTSGMIQSVDYRITASQYQHSSQKDVYPRLGQSLDIVYRNTPFGSNDLGSVFGASGNFFFPGIIRHQGIWLYCGYQHRIEKYLPAYSLSDFISFPRGYTQISDNELVSVKINYKIPVLYPDLSLGSVVYMKRIKLNLFYDWAGSRDPLLTPGYQSTGAELTFDFHLLRFVIPIEMGLRSIYYPFSGGYGFEFLYSISY